MAKKEECDGRPYSVKIRVAPLSASIFRFAKTEDKTADNKAAKRKRKMVSTRKNGWKQEIQEKMEQAEKEVHTAAVPHAEELEMEFEDEFEDDDEDEEDEEVMKEDLIVTKEIVTEDEDLDKDLDEDFDEDLDEFWDDEDDDVEIVEIDLSDQDDEDK